ncbi:DUF4422 domain-containing protein [Oribacterium sp. FC2011]|uniref:DUF4422 domain-containing protein n=1 Tax=Oribacterium sp. FC2011 TaxID=1408311 RepID=UPI0004E17175|nr:DUF4422 domain-containing protein [Oribacterium sp. FC2011]
MDNSSKIIIYGAGIIARQLYYSLVRHNKKDEIFCFAVTSMQGNPSEIDGIDVKPFEECLPKAKDCYIYLAMGERLWSTITGFIEKHGCKVYRKYGFRQINELVFDDFIYDFNENNSLIEILDDVFDDTYQNIVEKGTSIDDLQDILNVQHCKYLMLVAKDSKWLEKGFAGFDLREDYEKQLGKYRNAHDILSKAGKKNINTTSKNNSVNVFMCTSHYNKADNITGELPEWVVPVQGGASLTDCRIAEIRDDLGDNISDKNRLYSEMSVMYWAWKNVKNVSYKGLCHYRRRFILSDQEVDILPESVINVILTTPRVTTYGLRHLFVDEYPLTTNDFLEDVTNAVEHMHPGEGKIFACYLDNRFYYPNNMLIAQACVFDDYCEWIFGILFELEETYRVQCIPIKERSIGYAAELLTGYYFMKMKDKLKIAVTDYNFYD